MGIKFYLFVLLLLILFCCGRERRQIKLKVNFEEHTFKILDQKASIDSIVLYINNHVDSTTTYFRIHKNKKIFIDSVSLSCLDSNFIQINTIENFLKADRGKNTSFFKVFGTDREGNKVLFYGSYNTNSVPSALFENDEQME